MSKFDVRGNGCETYRHGKCCGNCAHFSDQSGRSILTEQRCKKWGDYFCMIFGLCNEWTPHENIAEEMTSAPKRPRPKAMFARWLNRNGASYDNDIWSQCDLDDFARRAWNAGYRAAKKERN